MTEKNSPMPSMLGERIAMAQGVITSVEERWEHIQYSTPHPSMAIMLQAAANVVNAANRLDALVRIAELETHLCDHNRRKREAAEGAKAVELQIDKLKAVLDS